MTNIFQKSLGMIKKWPKRYNKIKNQWKCRGIFIILTGKFLIFDYCHKVNENLRSNFLIGNAPNIGFLFYYTFLVIFLLYLEIFEKSLLYLFWLYFMIFRRVGYTYFIIPILSQNCLLYLSLLYFLWRV